MLIAVSVFLCVSLKLKINICFYVQCVPVIMVEKYFGKCVTLKYVETNKLDILETTHKQF